MGAKYGLFEHEELVLRAIMTGLPNKQVQSFLGRGEEKLRQHREAVLSRLGKLDRIHFYLVTWYNRRLRNRELKAKAMEEVAKQILRKKRAG